VNSGGLAWSSDLASKPDVPQSISCRQCLYAQSPPKDEAQAGSFGLDLGSSSSSPVHQASEASGVSWMEMIE